MKEDLKNKIIPVLSLLTIIFLIVAIVSSQNAAKQRGLLNQEMSSNMELEERALDLSNRNANLEQKLTQLQVEKDECEAARQTFNQEISQLKEELQRLAQ